MKKQNKQDERVLAQRRKVNSEALGILMIILFCSIFIQQFWLHASFEQYAVEVICFLGIALYMVIRYIMLGLDLYGEGTQTRGLPLVNSIAAGIIATAINGVLNYIKYAEHYKGNIGLFIAGLVIFFFSATASVFIVLLLIGYLDKKKQKQIEKRLDEEEWSK